MNVFRRDEAFLNEMMELIQAGHGYKAVASRMGISVGSAHYWVKKLRTVNEIKSLWHDTAITEACTEYENSPDSMAAIAQKYQVSFSKLRLFIQKESPESILRHEEALTRQRVLKVYDQVITRLIRERGKILNND